MKKTIKVSLASLLTLVMLFSLTLIPVAMAVGENTSSTSSNTVTGSSSLFSNLINGLANKVSGTTSSSTGTLEVHKVDAENTAVKLSGAEFTVYQDTDKDGTFNSANDSVIGKMTEKSTKGEYELSGLPAGTYFVQETKAPTDYELNNEIFKAELATTGTVNSVETTTDANQSGTNSGNTGTNGLQLDNTALTKAIQEALTQIGKTTGDGITGIAGAVNNDLTGLSLNDILPESTIQNLADSLSAQGKSALSTTVSSLTNFLQAAGVPTKQIMSAISNIIYQVITGAKDMPLVDGLIDISSTAITPILAAFIGEAPASAISEGLKTGIDAGISIISSLISTVGKPIIDQLIDNGFGADIIVPLISDIINKGVQTLAGSNVLDSVADAGISSAYSIADSILKVGGATAAQANEAIAQTVASLIQNPSLANGVSGASDTLMSVFNALNPLSNLQIGTNQQNALNTALQALAGIGTSSGIGTSNGILGLLTGATGTTGTETVAMVGGAIQIPDKKSTGSITVEKKDTQSGDPISGAQFKVYEDTNGNGKFDSADIVVSNLPETSKDGVYSGEVKAGTYFIEESKSGTGYTKDTNIYKVTVEPYTAPAEEVTEVTLPKSADGNKVTVVTDTKGDTKSETVSNTGTTTTTTTPSSGSESVVVAQTGNTGNATVEPSAQVYTVNPGGSESVQPSQTDATPSGSSTTTTTNAPASDSGTVTNSTNESGEPVVIVESTPDTGIGMIVPLAMMAVAGSGSGLFVLSRKKEE